jgi:hypothetical protein
MSPVVLERTDFAVRYIVRAIMVVSRTSGSHDVEDESVGELDIPG